MKQITLDKIINWAFAILALIGCIHTLVWYFYDPTLWLDDAMLMKSVVTRDFSGILQGMFDFNQSAPVGYMLIVKCFETVLGNSPMSLRLYSLLLYFASAWLIYLLAKNTFKFKYPLMPMALFLSMNVIQGYANATKPYMADVCLSLLAMWLYYLYTAKKMSAVCGFALMSLFVWFAFGALFTMGGICAYHFFDNSWCFYKKNISWSKYLKIVSPLCIVALSVGLYYLLWALPASQNTPSINEDNSWTFLSFPLIPKGIDDLKLICQMFRNITSPIHKTLLAQYCIALLCVCRLRYKSWYVVAFFIMVLMVMVVSSIGLYPIALRLLLSQFVIMSFLAFYGFDMMLANVARNKITISLTFLLICLPILFTVKNSFDFRQKMFFAANEQYKKCIDYIYQVKSKDAKIYISNIERPMAEYYSNYETSSKFLEPHIIEKGDKIWGTNYRQLHNDKAYEYKFYMLHDKVEENIAAIKKYNDVYMIDVHSEGEVFNKFLKSLHASGAHVEMVYNFCDSRVYRYQK